MKFFGLELKFNGFDIWHEGNFDPVAKADTDHNHVKADITDFPSALPANGGNADTVDGVHASSLAPLASVSAVLPATAGWYRIASSALGIVRNSGIFLVDWAISGEHGRVIFTAGCHYGQDATINQLAHESYSGQLTQIRVVYHTTYSGNYAYVEIYHNAATAITVKVDVIDALGWTLVTPNTPGSIPSGYSSKAVNIVDGISTNKQFRSNIATGTAPLVVASTTKVTNLNADYVDGYGAGNASGDIPISNGTLNTNLNADLLDGNHASAFALAGHTHTKAQITDMPTKLSQFENDIGAGAGLNIVASPTEPAINAGDWWYKEI